jgi:hypothetical protein
VTNLPPATEEPLTPRERLRRVVIVCASFGRNLAYYRVGHDQGRALHSVAHRHASFWRQANCNFLDQCVLEWCKLFGERERGRVGYGWGEHGWRLVVANPAAYEDGLLAELDMTVVEFGDLVETMRHYRDKFVAHLDADRTMSVPELSKARASVWFYHKHVVALEAAGGDLACLPDTADKMELGYKQCVDEARKIYRIAETIAQA